MKLRQFMRQVKSTKRIIKDAIVDHFRKMWENVLDKPVLNLKNVSFYSVVHT